MRRRQLLRGAALAGAGSLAGCGDVGIFADFRPDRPALLDDPPDDVYVPTSVSGWHTTGTGTAGDYAVTVAYTYPQRYWTVEGDQTTRVSLDSDSEIYVAAIPWDRETGDVIPAGAADEGIDLSLRLGQAAAAAGTLRPSLSQHFGFHYGANIIIPGQGEYTASLTLPGSDWFKMGGHNGRFTGPVSTNVPFKFEPNTLETIPISEPDNPGQRGAVPRINADEPPESQVPETLAGTRVAEVRLDDAPVVVYNVPAVSKNARSGSVMLGISPRTPYNRYALPFAEYRATVQGGIQDERMDPGISPGLGIHYGVPTETLDVGDRVTIRQSVPPQVDRHEGYETAFFGAAEATLTITGP